jgi:replicative DNA helicase
MIKIKMDYQIERLHIYGDKHPSSGLKNKVVGWQFKNTVEIIDPVTKVKTKEPMKPFMVNQLALTIERNRLILSPFDEKLHQQLVDYVVEKVTDTGVPKYTSKNEHFVDALGLAHLAFVLKFPDLTQAIKKIEFSSKMAHSNVRLGSERIENELRGGTSMNPWGNLKQIGKEPGERPGDYQKWVKVPMRATPSNYSSRSSWGSRTSGRGMGGRSMW